MHVPPYFLYLTRINQKGGQNHSSPGEDVVKQKLIDLLYWLLLLTPDLGFGLECSFKDFALM